MWLANSIGDQRFVSREIQKITNFVESGDAARAIPVISFIARQRDLRELVGEKITGTVELSFQDTLDPDSARFNTITLEAPRPVSPGGAYRVQHLAGVVERTRAVRLRGPNPRLSD